MKKLICTICILGMVGAITPAYPCEDGGEGATSCSHTTTHTFFFGLFSTDETHSITCRDGYYACCTDDAAECVPERPTFEQG